LLICPVTPSTFSTQYNLSYQDKTMDKNIGLQKKLVEKIALNIAEHEMRNIAKGNRTYPEIHQEVKKSVEYASKVHLHQLRKSGEPYIFHPLNVALIAAETGMIDKISIDSCLLHDVIEDGEVSRNEISTLFGEEVAEVVEGLTKIKANKYESYDKFFSHTINNPRVAYIKIFDRLHNLRTLSYLPPEKQGRIANESMDIYHKLCIRLCLTDIANEIELLCAPILYPDTFPLFSARLKQIQEEASSIIDAFKMGLLEKCHEHDVKIRKIRSQWKPFLNISDYSFMNIPNVLLFKLVVDSIENTYKMVWLINSSYKVAGNIEDHISVPKFNNFRGINYTVVVEGIKIPLLITTDKFNEYNRKGILVYGSFSKDTTINRKLMDHLQEYLTNESDFMDVTTLISFIEKDEIQVFAKDGKTIVELKKGATVLDFAFKIHTDIGLRADYGVIDGVRVGLGHVLSNGNVVQIYTKNTITATEEFLKKCVSPKAQRVLKKHFENAHTGALFNISKYYIEKYLGSFHIDENTFWEKLRELCPVEKDLTEKVIGVLCALPEAEKLFVELGLIDDEQIALWRRKNESFLTIWNIFSSSQKKLPLELDFLDENYISCPICVPTLSNTPHRGILNQNRFTVHSGNCTMIENFTEERIFSVKFKKNMRIDSKIYMRIETDDVSGITHAISSVFKNVNLEIFNVENDHTKALYRLAYYQKSPQIVSSYLEQLHKIPEIRSIIISKKNVSVIQL
jgi:guanosine-3',5'-bis(diphosphate) 3'-pyrophosphohydrolase